LAFAAATHPPGVLQLVFGDRLAACWLLPTCFSLQGCNQQQHIGE
jgi:hypothetical protein